MSESGYETDIDLNHENVTIKYLDDNTVSLEEFLIKIVINGTIEVTPDDFNWTNKAEKTFYQLNSENNFQISIFYIDNLKCFNFDLKNLNLKVENLNSLVQMTINSTKLPKKRISVFLTQPQLFRLQLE